MEKSCDGLSVDIHPRTYWDLYRRLSLLALLSSAGSLLFELMISFILSKYTLNPAFWQITSLGFFLCAFGLGVIFSGKSLKDRYPELARGIPLSQWLDVTSMRICLQLFWIHALTPFFVLFTHTIYRIYFRTYGMEVEIHPLNFWAISILLVTCWCGWLSGGLMGRNLEAFRHVDSTRHIAWLMLCCEFGSLLGVLIFAASLYSGFSFIAVFLVSAFFYSVVLLDWKKLCRAFVLIIVLGIFSSLCEEFSLKNFYYNEEVWTIENNEFEWKGSKSIFHFLREAKSLPKVQRFNTRYQWIDLVHNQEDSKQFAVFLDHHYQFDRQREKNYHETFAKSYVELYKTYPRHVLIIGGGDGLLARTLLEDTRVEQIDLVEIDPQMIQLARNQVDFLSLNQRSLHSNKVRIHIDDAFLWLQRSRAEYDFIFMDVPYPFTADVSKLFSQEMFILIRHHLSSSGGFVMDAPIAFGNVSKNDLLVSSVFSAGFQEAILYKSQFDSFLTAAKNPEGELLPKPLRHPDFLRIRKISQPITVNSVFSPRQFPFVDHSL